MKTFIKNSTILILVMMLCVNLESKCQSQNNKDPQLMTVFKDIYKKNLSDLADCRTLVQSLSLLTVDTAYIKAENRRKEAVIQKQSQILTSRGTEIDTLNSAVKHQRKIITDQQEIISEQDKTIKRIGKPKRFGLGIGAGYGIAGTGYGGGAFVGITYSIIRF